MADEKILIDGKEYISSGRAARLVGYTKDYVGQLARDGKINAKRIGRNWYIEEDSITKHKLSVHYVLTKPKKTSSTEKYINEKANKNIENTDKDTFSSHLVSSEKPNVVLSENVLSLSDNHDVIGKEENENQQNFLPPLQKKKSSKDVLLHTNIRYESYEPQKAKQFVSSLHTQAPVHELKDALSKQYPSKNFANPQHTDAVRKPRVRKVVLSPHAIDGVVTMANPRHRSRVPEHNRAKPKISERLTKEIVQEQIPAHLQEGEMTKTVPVIGAIVLFTIVVLSYIFFIAN